MAVDVVVFDVGETLVDETRMWERAADAAGVPRFTLMGVLGGLAARGRPHSDVWEIVGVGHPASTWEPCDYYPDALPAIEALRGRGLVVGAVGNTPSSRRSSSVPSSTSSAPPRAGVSRSPPEASSPA